jgi:hypothetical protein
MAELLNCTRCRLRIASSKSGLCPACARAEAGQSTPPSAKPAAERRRRKEAQKRREGQCPYCLKTLKVKADGHLGSHKNGKTGKHCVGSGGPPIYKVKALKVGSGPKSVRAVGGGLPTLGKGRR